jgi:predicted ATP-grasp superfamily ATP-dependent carboligase
MGVLKQTSRKRFSIANLPYSEEQINMAAKINEAYKRQKMHVKEVKQVQSRREASKPAPKPQIRCHGAVLNLNSGIALIKHQIDGIKVPDYNAVEEDVVSKAASSAMLKLQ